MTSFITSVFYYILQLCLFSLCAGHAVATPSSVAALWSVRPALAADVTSPPCLLMAANLSVVFVHPGEDVRQMSEDLRRLHWRLAVPSSASSRGECGDTGLQAEVSLHWSEAGGESNLLNLVVTRNNRLADLTGVFARLHLHSKTFELTSSLKKNDKDSLTWPHRYCLSCQRTLYYPLYKVSAVKRNHNDNKDDDVPPEAFLLMDNLMLEVFRESDAAVQGEDGELLAKTFSRRSWECEFHLIFDWAPYAIGGSLVFLVVLMIVSFCFKSYLGCSDYSRRETSYQKL